MFVYKYLPQHTHGHEHVWGQQLARFGSLPLEQFENTI